MRPKVYLALNNSFPFVRRGLCSHTNSKYVNQAQSGKENFEKDFEKSHVETNLFQKFILGIGSGVLSISSPSRGDMVAVLGEVTGPRALKYVRSKMLQSPEGRKILEEKPRISSATVNLELLKSYPEGTLGKSYSNFLQHYGYSPDARNAVRFVDDMELAYVAQRYREVHDLFHTIFHMPTNMLGEVTVKWVEAIQTRLPMCVTGALFGSVRLAPKLTRAYSTKVVLRIDSALDKKIQSNEIKPRFHPGIMNLKCIRLPDGIIKSIIIETEGENRKYLIESGLNLEQRLLQRRVPLEQEYVQAKSVKVIEELRETNFVLEWKDVEDNVEKKLRKMAIKKLKTELYNWQPIVYCGNICEQYLVVRGPAEYAALKRVFNEIYLRDNKFRPTNLFDFGSGVGTAIWAANEIWGETLKQYYCVDSSRDMNNLAGKILENKHYANAPDINKVYFRQFLPVSPLPHDIVVSAFTLFELTNCKERLRTLTTLWNNTSRYLVLLEQGSNAGHSLIEEARSYLLELSRIYNVPCYVFAPCPHELPCPRFEALGKLTPCNFAVRYFNLPIKKWVHAAGTQRFSYLILRKGEQPPETRQSRIVRDVARRHKHVVCHMCTPHGKLETFFVSKHNSGKSLYACMKRSNWGDVTPEGVTLEKQVPRVRAEEKLTDQERSDDSEEESSDDQGELISDDETDEDSSDDEGVEKNKK